MWIINNNNNNKKSQTIPNSVITRTVAVNYSHCLKIQVSTLVLSCRILKSGMNKKTSHKHIYSNQILQFFSSEKKSIMEFAAFPKISKSRFWWTTLDTAFQNRGSLTDKWCPASCFFILHLQSSNVWISVEFDLAIHHKEKSDFSSN